MKKDNPFPVSGYLGPKLFCDRNDETDRIIQAIDNGRNLTLFSKRRIGKTGLLNHVAYHLAKRKNTLPIYIDIMGTTSLKDFVSALGVAVIEKINQKDKNIFKRALQFFANIRPTISFDSITGEPQVTVDVAENRGGQTLKQIFAYLKEQKYNGILIIDEFQQIINYEEKNVEALLRSEIQQIPEVNFIFSGSHQHLIVPMFNKYSRPFYQSTEMMYLDKIDAKIYKQFIKRKFRQKKVSIEKDALELIMEWTRGHTYYTQYLCNKLYNSADRNIDEKFAYIAMKNILKENEHIYYGFRSLLTDLQFNVLKAIAKEGSEDEPTSKRFIGGHQLGAPSSVKLAISALIDKEMVYEESGAYWVYDVFLSRWLEKY